MSDNVSLCFREDLQASLNTSTAHKNVLLKCLPFPRTALTHCRIFFISHGFTIFTDCLQQSTLLWVHSEMSWRIHTSFLCTTEHDRNTAFCNFNLQLQQPLKLHSATHIISRTAASHIPFSSILRAVNSQVEHFQLAHQPQALARNETYAHRAKKKMWQATK